jgi:hypothetical protein
MESDAKRAQRRRSRATAANERTRRRTKKTRSFPSDPAWETRNARSVVGRWMISFYGLQNSTMVRNSVWYLEYFNTFLFSDANLSGIVLISGYIPIYILLMWDPGVLFFISSNFCDIHHLVFFRKKELLVKFILRNLKFPDFRSIKWKHLSGEKQS